MTPKKSLTLDKIKVPSPYFPDFLRGVIDGDGSIHTWKHPSNGNIQWALRIFSGSQKFIDWLKITTEESFKVQGKIHITKTYKKNALYQLKFGKFATKIIFSKSYYTDCLSLKRKYLLALECLKAKDKLKKYGVHKARVV
ncbi:MAG TPA: hypothetical protein VE973_01405 [Candidatus Limnocylindria bacterium]|nr:hypothetical protein [Candidatus Limnocylindria bacterium]